MLPKVDNWQCPKCGAIKSENAMQSLIKSNERTMCHCGEAVLTEYNPWSPMNPEFDKIPEEASAAIRKKMEADGVEPSVIDLLEGGGVIKDQHREDREQHEVEVRACKYCGEPINDCRCRENVEPEKKLGMGGLQQGGAHYGNPKTDPFAFACANDLDPVSFSIVKYGMRIGKKGERDQWILDARKAIQCTERRCADLGITLEELYAT